MVNYVVLFATCQFCRARDALLSQPVLDERDGLGVGVPPFCIVVVEGMGTDGSEPKEPVLGFTAERDLELDEDAMLVDRERINVVEGLNVVLLRQSLMAKYRKISIRNRVFSRGITYNCSS